LFTSNGLDYVNVQPGRLMNWLAWGGVRASADGKGLKPAMSGEDLAEFMVDQIASAAWARQSVVVGYLIDLKTKISRGERLAT
jgi:hypothetical protein